MANTSNSDRWFFTKEQLENTPSRKCGFDAYKELQYRQQAANFIQDIGQRLTVSQLCINTAIVYMHRFYVFHSFTDFHWHQMAAAALFLAAKVEEQPRKLEYVIRVANMCKNRNLDVNSERYAAQSQDLVFNENVLLQTLGFDVAIDHPHTYVVKCCHLVRASKDLAQTSYFMANNSLHLTTMCIQYKPTVVACFCILLACKWSNWEIPLSNEKKEWFTYVDPTVTAELLQQLTSEFLVIFENCPSRLKEKIMAKQESAGNLFDQDSNKKESGSSSSSRSLDEHHKHRSSRPPPPSSESAAPSVGHRSQEQRERDFKERKEKERLAHMTGGGLTTTASSSNNQHNPHHHNPRPQTDPNKMKPHSRPPSNGGSGPFQPSSSSNSQQRNEPRDILRDVAKDSSSSSTSFGIPAVRGGGGGDKDQRSKQQHVSSLLKNNVPQQQQSVDPNNLTNNYRGIVDPNNTRSRSDPLLSKTLSKQEMMRRYEEQKNPHLKTEIDTIKKHLNSTSFDKNNSVYFKSSSSSSSTSHKVKSPFNLDNNNKMSVPKVTNIINNGPHSSKPQFNGNNNNNNANGSYDKPSHDHHNNMVDVVKIKTESHLPSSVVKEEIPIPAIIKRPSLFSPDQPPPQQSIHIKSSEPTIIDKFMMSSSASSSLNILSPINSPPSVPSARNRNYSTGSEPELRPTLKKIDQVEGFENLMRDNTIGMTNMSQNSTSIEMKIKDEIKTEPYSSLSLSVKAEIPSSATTVVNGLETNPILISNLLKEAAAAPSSSHLSGIVSTSSGSASAKIDNVEPATSVLIVSQSVQLQEKEHRHHKSKKNKKEKHKHKDRTNKEENKEKKRKHKDKDREKHSKHKERKEHETSTSSSSVPLISEPIKIKIQKDKIQPINQLKIKIPKDKIRTEGIVESMTSHHQQQQPLIGGLKIKIPKDVIANCNPSTSSFSSSFITTSATTNNSSRKRDREKSSSSSATGIPAAKVSKSSHKESKQNGRNSYSKVSEQHPTNSNNSQVESISSVMQKINSSNNYSSRLLSGGIVASSSSSSTSSNNNTNQLPNSSSSSSSIKMNVSLDFRAHPPMLSPLSSSSTTDNITQSKNTKLSTTTTYSRPTTTAPPSYSSCSSSSHQRPPPNYSSSTNFNNNSNINNASTFPTNPNFPNRQTTSSITHSSSKSSKRSRVARNVNVVAPPRYSNNMIQQQQQMQLENNSFNQYSQYSGQFPTTMSMLPNIRMPPPSYGMYNNYLTGYNNNNMMSEMYHHPQQSTVQNFGGDFIKANNTVGQQQQQQPPLPMDAPPFSDAPPPPPPE